MIIWISAKFWNYKSCVETWILLIIFSSPNNFSQSPNNFSQPNYTLAYFQINNKNHFRSHIRPWINVDSTTVRDKWACKPCLSYWYAMTFHMGYSSCLITRLLQCLWVMNMSPFFQGFRWRLHLATVLFLWPMCVFYLSCSLSELIVL